MATPKKASEVQLTSETVEEVKTAVGLLTLEQYVQRSKANPGTVASFKYEAKKAGDALQPRTKTEWEQALEAQSKKRYTK